MATEVHRQRPPAWAQWLHICTMPIGYCRVITSHQGCPIGIPKNPEIPGSSRKSSLSAAEEVHSACAKYRESKVGGGGGGCSSRTQYKNIRRIVFFP